MSSKALQKVELYRLRQLLGADDEDETRVGSPRANPQWAVYWLHRLEATRDTKRPGFGTRKDGSEGR